MINWEKDMTISSFKLPLHLYPPPLPPHPPYGSKDVPVIYRNRAGWEKRGIVADFAPNVNVPMYNAADIFSFGASGVKTACKCCGQKIDLMKTQVSGTVYGFRGKVENGLPIYEEL